MHPIIKRQCRQDLTIHPFDKRVDGNRSFKDDVAVKCYSEAKVRIVKNPQGEDVTSTTTIIMDGADLDKITVQDDVSMDLIQRRAVINIQAFPGVFTAGYDHLEVYV